MSSNEYAQAAKRDFALMFAADAREACGYVKGREVPDFKNGSVMNYSADGVISWGKGSFNYVQEPGAKLMLNNARSEKTFSFGVDIYDKKDERLYVAGLSQLNGASLNATVTDETKAVDGNSDQTTGNLCVGKTVPPLISRGAWQLAVKYLQVPKTTMSCVRLGKFEFMDVDFAFDGKVITAGEHRFTEADAQHSENWSIDPHRDGAAIVYSMYKADGSGVGIGVSQANKLTFAELTPAKGDVLTCSTK
ncbi:MAG: hypothetical protein HY253_06960 [Burkholderiales bacterium]|nr:hypothetical protein [Burkholderiales bacterium]